MGWCESEKMVLVLHGRLYMIYYLVFTHGQTIDNSCLGWKTKKKNKHKLGLLRGKKPLGKIWTDIKVKPSSLSYRWNILNRTLKQKLWTPLGTTLETALWILNRLWRQVEKKNLDPENKHVWTWKVSADSPETFLLIVLLHLYRSGLWRQKTLATPSPEAVTATDASLRRGK